MTKLAWVALLSASVWSSGAMAAMVALTFSATVAESNHPALPAGAVMTGSLRYDDAVDSLGASDMPAAFMLQDVPGAILVLTSGEIRLELPLRLISLDETQPGVASFTIAAASEPPLGAPDQAMLAFLRRSNLAAGSFAGRTLAGALDDQLLEGADLTLSGEAGGDRPSFHLVGIVTPRTPGLPVADAIPLGQRRLGTSPLGPIPFGSVVPR